MNIVTNMIPGLQTGETKTSSGVFKGLGNIARSLFPQPLCASGNHSSGSRDPLFNTKLQLNNARVRLSDLERRLSEAKGDFAYVKTQPESYQRENDKQLISKDIKNLKTEIEDAGYALELVQQDYNQLSVDR